MSSQLDALALSFPLPTRAQDRVELTNDDIPLLVLLGLSAINAAIAGGGTSGAAITPTFVNVTATSSVAAAASTAPRTVQLFNNGESDVLFLIGGTPKWTGQDSATSDQGLVLKPGGWYESDSITTVINVRTKTGETSTLTVLTKA